MRYQVTWGELSGVVDAGDENEAWAKFCEGNPDILIHPKAFERAINQVEAAAESSALGESLPAEHEESPVDNVNAAEAIEQIGRMRSTQKLQHIVDNDTRVTVVDAAKKRLAELA